MRDGNEITSLKAERVHTHAEVAVPRDEVEARLTAARDEIEAVVEKHGLHVFVGSFSLFTPREAFGRVLIRGCANCAVPAVENLKEQLMEARRRTAHLQPKSGRRH